MTFNPDKSGKYSFDVTATRNGEEAVHHGETVEVDFTLPLTKPNVKGVFNNGDGTVTVEWDAVKEAVEYTVEAKEGGEVKATASDKEGKLSAVLTGLEMGKTYSVTVTAKRGGDSAVSGAEEVTVSNKKDVPWYFAAFGSSTSTNPEQNGYSENENGTVSVWSLGGKGKLVPNSTDGIAFYYTKLSTDYNFKLTGKVHVDEWTYSNGQDGFGLMVSDRVGAHGAGADFWNNSYMAVVTKVEYNWNSIDGKLTDSGGTKYSMRSGVGSQEKINVTPDNINDPNLAKDIFKSTMTTLETTAGQKNLDAGTYNICGNCQGGLKDIESIIELTDFVFSIERNPTGYFVSYTPEGAAEPTVVKYYDTKALSHLDPENVYLGFFASRNAKITVSDIELETILASEDTREPEERPITKITPNYTIESATVANSAEYDLVYYGNADGTLVVKDPSGEEIFNGSVKANEKTHIETTLASGANAFTVTMTPNEDYKPSEFEVMADYEPRTLTHTVNFAVSARDIIYVAPGANGSGGRYDPMDIYRAVQIAAPGQTVVLLEGTYNLAGTLTIERGINGTEDAYITMMADPDAATRPVLDFGGKCAGMVIAGDYWHFYGFDVTRSANGQKGIQVSGDHNVLERLLTYRNGNTGIQISRFKGSDLFADWPSYNLILNCSSYLNADSGYEDADGFAAKLTIADGNRFYGCISAYNADDGWDLFAKVETGSIGKVVIENSLSFKNGWILGEDGREINAGNGNGFKMGGESIPGHHTLINSVSFGNKAKGFDSNSCPDIEVYNSTAFNNNSYNVAMYTNSASETGYKADGILSYKNNGNTTGEQFKLKGNQKEEELRGESNYYYDGSKSVNSAGTQVDDTWFESVDMEAAVNGGIKRNEDGSIDMGGFLVLTDAAAKNAGAHMDDISNAPEAPALPELPEESAPAPVVPSTPSVTTGDKTEEGETVTETTATPGASVKDGTASSQVTDSMGKEIVKQAESNKSDTVVVAPKTSGDVTKAEVTIPGKTVTDIAEKTEADLRVETPVGSVTLPDEALPELGKAGDVAVSVEKTEDTVSVQVSAGGETVGSVTGGVKASFELKDGEVAVIVAEDGTETVVPKSVVEDGTAYVLLDGSATVKIVDNSKEFEDVGSGDWFEDAVTFASSHELFKGTGDTTFEPETDMNRAMLATVLWRLESEAASDGEVTFPDVSGDAWYTDGINWAAATGVITGSDEGVFEPDREVTRQEMAVMLYRYAKNVGIDTTKAVDLTAFTDAADLADWAAEAMSWAVSVGLFQGNDSGLLDPAGSASRAQVAVVLQRLVAMMVK